MIKKNNYPVRYSVLDIKLNDNIIGYIVSKCFILESTIKYASNDNIIVKHKVIFPYTDIKPFIKSYGTNQQLEMTYNILEVDEIYDNYIEAKKITEENNKRILDNTKEYNKIEDTKNYLYLCKQFEQLIEKNTQNMIVGENVHKKYILKKEI